MINETVICNSTCIQFLEKFTPIDICFWVFEKIVRIFSLKEAQLFTNFGYIRFFTLRSFHYKQNANPPRFCIFPSIYDHTYKTFNAFILAGTHTGVLGIDYTMNSKFW